MMDCEYADRGSRPRLHGHPGSCRHLLARNSRHSIGSAALVGCHRQVSRCFRQRLPASRRRLRKFPKMRRGRTSNRPFPTAARAKCWATEARYRLAAACDYIRDRSRNAGSKPRAERLPGPSPIGPAGMARAPKPTVATRSSCSSGFIFRHSWRWRLHGGARSPDPGGDQSPRTGWPTIKARC